MFSNRIGDYKQGNLHVKILDLNMIFTIKVTRSNIL